MNRTSRFLISLSVMLPLALPVSAQNLQGGVDVNLQGDTRAGNANVRVETRTRVNANTGPRDVLKNFRDAKQKTREEFQIEVRDARDQKKEEVRDFRQDERGDRQEVRQEMRVELKDLRESGDRAAFDARRDQFRADINAKRDAFRDRIEEGKEGFREDVERKRDELRERLELIRDEKKKEIVERLNDRLHNLIENWADRFSDIAKKLEDILNRIASRADKAAANGHDTSAVESAIVEAEVAIAALRDGIAANLRATYSFEFTNDTDLRSAVERVKNIVQNELRELRGLARVARDAVRRAAEALKNIPRVNDLEVEASTEVESNTSVDIE